MRPIRRHINIEGMVQGVGFRPFVYRTAVSFMLKGFVRNTPLGVEIEAEGPPAALEAFILTLQERAPALAQVRSVQANDLPLRGGPEFVILESESVGEVAALVSPDAAVCADCLLELTDPADRRYRYPFINCTNCGPRYTIVRGIPYDRPNTTMSVFTMCSDCQREYETPSDRRFHAQPNACPVCGPSLQLTDAEGRSVPGGDAVRTAARMLQEGNILAVKGLGGFHLACDAANDRAVLELRRRKAREEKPLAVMAFDLDAASRIAVLSDAEGDLLRSFRKPIVLAKKRLPEVLSAAVAPNNAYYGVLLPYAPLHHLLLSDGPRILVMTSGNVSEEPMAVSNRDAYRRLAGIADHFLVHDRDIHVRNDDTVVRIVAGIPAMVRRSRGFVPVPVFLRRRLPAVLGVGGELKNTVCLVHGERGFFSHHVGDLENAETFDAFEQAVGHVEALFQIRPQALAYDPHPDYLATRWALGRAESTAGMKALPVQHHHAHIVSCLAENGREDRVIGIAADGTGFGPDGTVWGGEVLLADPGAFERAAHLAVRPMPGGAQAVRDPWRMALAYLVHAMEKDFSGEDAESSIFRKVSALGFVKSMGQEKIRAVVRMIRSKIPMPLTSSLGRLFDAVAAIAGVRDRSAFEGQAAMELEMAMEESTGTYTFGIDISQYPFKMNPDPVLRDAFHDACQGLSAGKISTRFHRSVVNAFAEVSAKLREKTGINTVALSGGCFQNRFLSETIKQVLEKQGFEVLIHSQVPANDGGLALGQAVSVAYRIKD
jgi:hydrogenase maturation protein HypF